MKTEVYTKEKLLLLLKSTTKTLGRLPTKKEWNENPNLPSDIPIRMKFGNWTNFIKEAGYTPRVSAISIQARLNSIQAHKGKRSMACKGGRIKDRLGYIQAKSMGSHLHN